MGRIAKWDWEELLKEYLKSEYVTKTDFAKAKGINPSLLRRNTTNWPNKGKGETAVSVTVTGKDSKKNSNNVTKKVVTDKNVIQKDVTNKSNKKTETRKGNVTQSDTKNDTQKNSNKGSKGAAQRDKSKINNYLKVINPPDPDEELTEKQKLFCLYYVKNFNATLAAKNAGFSENCLSEIGYQLLQKTSVRKEIARLKELRYQSIAVQADDLVEKHMRIAFSVVTDFIEFGRIEKVVGKIKRKVLNLKTGKEEDIEFPLTAMVNDVRFKESTEVDGSIIKSVKMGRDGASIELLDPQKSMDWLERYFEWNPMDKHKKRFDNAKLKLEQEKLKIDQEQLEINKRKAGDEDDQETPDDGFIAAMNAEAPTVWGDGEDEE